jgi:hypothetical protein
LLPPPLLGGASTEPESPGPPRPVPFLPEPESPPEPIDEGGGTTLPASCVPLPGAPDPDGEPWPVLPPTEGGGGMTLDAPRDEPLPREEAEPAVPAPEPEIDGGGGTTLLASELPVPPGPLRVLSEAPAEETVGGGGTTSWVPKSLPMTVLTNDPLFACVGGGGTTEAEGSVVAPLSSRRRSCAESAEGGGVRALKPEEALPRRCSSALGWTKLRGRRLPEQAESRWYPRQVKPRCVPGKPWELGR